MRAGGVGGGSGIVFMGEVPVVAFGQHFIVGILRFPAEIEKWLHVEKERFVIGQVVPGCER